MQIAINSTPLDSSSPAVAAKKVKTEAAFGLSVLGYHRNMADFMTQGPPPAPRMSARL